MKVLKVQELAGSLQIQKVQRAEIEPKAMPRIPRGSTLIPEADTVARCARPCRIQCQATEQLKKIEHLRERKNRMMRSRSLSATHRFIGGRTSTAIGYLGGRMRESTRGRRGTQEQLSP
eukprot:7380696-Prymnesium_polylepis.1